MATITMAATVLPAVSNEAGFGELAFGGTGFGITQFVSGRPPRVRITVTDSGTPAVGEVTVVRVTADGTRVPVRTVDGAPLRLQTAGANRTGVVFDHEMPYQQLITYSTLERPAVTVTATVPETRVWLIHPAVPAMSTPVDFRHGSFDAEEEDVNAGVFRPLGRRDAVVITDGARKSGTGEFTVGTDTLAQAEAVRALLADAATLLLNVPPAAGLGLEAQYLAVQGVRYKRLSDIGSDPQRDIVMPYVATGRPAGGQRPALTWGDVAATYTWAQLAQRTWASVINPTT